MSELIFHHYAGSPFSEKIRLIFGHKQLPWRSVTIPNMMPKPDLIALTGGYRKTPVMQIGADVYCDSALMARVLEARQPTPSLYPGDAPLAPILAQWADSTLFWTVIPYSMQPAGAAALFAGTPPEIMKAFAADRAILSAGMRRPNAVDATAQLQTYLTALDRQLADGRVFLFGSSATIADFSVGHCLWFVQRAKPLAGILDAHTHLMKWLERVLVIGHGAHTRLDSDEALVICRSAGGHAPTAVQPDLGWALNSPVQVSAIDYGTDPVAGTLVGLTNDEVVIRREDPRAGVVHVHFPRIGFAIKAPPAA